MSTKNIVFATEIALTIAIYIILKVTCGLAIAELFMLLAYSLALSASIDTASKLLEKEQDNQESIEEDEGNKNIKPTSSKDPKRKED